MAAASPRPRLATRRTLAPERARRLAAVAPGACDGVRVVVVRRIAPGYAAMTIGRTVLVRHDRVDDDRLLAHELVHVEQWREHGAVGFLARYLGGYARALLRERRHHAAYLAIPFEVEARERARTWATAADLAADLPVTDGAERRRRSDGG